jgi:hypothetical protein
VEIVEQPDEKALLRRDELELTVAPPDPRSEKHEQPTAEIPA